MEIQRDFRFYIKVLAGARQGERIEIPLLDKMAGTAAPHAWIHEDEEICFMLVTPHDMESPVLWISDLPKPPSDFKKLSNKVIYLWHPESRGFNRYQAFFLNCFGSCKLDIEIRKREGEQLWIELSPFEVRAKKITAERLREIIKYLASRMNDLPGASFSVTQISAGQNKRSVTILLKEAEDGLNLFEQQLPILLTHHRTRLVPMRVVRIPGPADCFDANTAEWLISHLDILMPASEFNDALVTIDGHPYTANKLEVNDLVEESNVYENQVLHSYLNNMKTFLVEIRKECDRIQSHAPSSPREPKEEEKAGSDSGGSGRYVSFSIEIKSSIRELFKGRKTKCDQLLEKCNYLMGVLNAKIPVARFLAGVPSLTPWVKANFHYRILFERIIRWYQMGAPDWSDEERLVGVRSIDELYEYFCLYKLIDGLEKSGFQRKDSPDEKNHRIVYQDNIPMRRYEFEKGKTRLTLYYEKEIWSPKHKAFEKSSFFNVEGWIWDSCRRKGANAKRVPDYIFEISTDQQGDRDSANSVLAVFDAKYSPADTVFFEKLPVLVMRYVHGISGKGGGVSPVVSLYLLHPKETNQWGDKAPVRSFYTNDYDLFGSKAVIPALGAAEVDPASTYDISNLIERIVELSEQRLYSLSAKSVRNQVFENA